MEEIINLNYSNVYIEIDDTTNLQKLYKSINEKGDCKIHISINENDKNDKHNEIYDYIIKPKGKLILEFGGEKQIDSLEKIFSSDVYSLFFHKDLNNMKRILEITKK